ncbi:MAG TPA: phosphotransferase [Candidatus Limnocylindrales bacterium]|nr:phosphotransferase [Candidatus Limnocylindrales bacterium]
MKATGPGPAHEGPLLEVFRKRGVDHVLLPHAVHPHRPWFLSDDGGPTLRQTRPDGSGDHDLEAWERILREYAALQRSLESGEAVAAMRAAGVPDGRPEALAGELARLLADDAAWARLQDDERDEGRRVRARLPALLPDVATAAGALTKIGIAPSVQHDDLHGGNILVGPAGDRFFDWGDAVVAHPFATLTVTFNSIAHKTGLPQTDPAFARLEAVYVEAWTAVAGPAELAQAARLARVFGCLNRALNWERALVGVSEEELGQYGDAVAGWVIEFADRFDALSR